MKDEYKLILTSRGINTDVGKDLMKIVFNKEKLKLSSIFLITLPSYKIDGVVIKQCKELGFSEVYIAEEFEGEECDRIPDVDCVYITEGNTFEIADYIRKNDFDKYIQKQVIQNKVTYIGSSAGAIYAASNFKEAVNFDSNYIGMTSFKGLMLMPHENGFGVTVLPHYTYKQAQTYISNVNEVDKSLYSKVVKSKGEKNGK